MLEIPNQYLIDNRSASGTRFRSIVLLQYQHSCRGDDAKAICFTAMCIARYDGSFFFGRIEKKTSMYFTTMNAQSISFIHKLVILIKNRRENKYDELCWLPYCTSSFQHAWNIIYTISSYHPILFIPAPLSTVSLIKKIAHATIICQWRKFHETETT